MVIHWRSHAFKGFTVEAHGTVVLTARGTGSWSHPCVLSLVTVRIHMSGKLIRPAPLGSRELLLRMFEEPNLVAAVQALPAPALGKLIEHIGLADAGEIVALATTDQIRRIFDDDLWRSERPGQDETFAADRFASWLEIMLEAGEGFAAEKLAELPEDLVTLALSKQVLVVDLDELAATLAPSLSDDD